jgi:type I restriction enzyme, S subunit
LVAVPPLPEQQEIARRVRALLVLAETVERRVTLAIGETENLIQAILSRAFRGELVPTEAELARQEGRDYEPASVLLERIRAHRNGAGTSPTRRASRRLAPRAAAENGETLEQLWEG